MNLLIKMYVEKAFAMIEMIPITRVKDVFFKKVRIQHVQSVMAQVIQHCFTETQIKLLPKVEGLNSENSNLVTKPTAENQGTDRPLVEVKVSEDEAIQERTEVEVDNTKENQGNRESLEDLLITNQMVLAVLVIMSLNHTIQQMILFNKKIVIVTIVFLSPM